MKASCWSSILPPSLFCIISIGYVLSTRQGPWGLETLLKEIQYRNIIERLSKEKEILVYNRAGKCGSRSLIRVFQQLKTRNNFTVLDIPRSVSLNLSPREFNNITKDIQAVNGSVLYVRHFHFKPFRNIANYQYINMIRNPVSYRYY